jgi:YbbR domain-containing protein
MISFFRRYVFHNLGLKLIALAAAVLLWMSVARDPVAEIAITVPIEFTHVPENLEISSERIPDAQIRVRGPGRQVRRLAQEQIHAIVDLQDAKPGEHTYELGGSQVHVPREVEVVQVVPPQLRLEIDQFARREVRVEPRVIGALAPGLQVTKLTAEPAMVEVAGPWKRVQAIQSALADPVDATGVVGHANFPAQPVYLHDPLVRIVRPSTVSVTVYTGESATMSH